MLPCCENQKPNLKPPILKLSNFSDHNIPKPNETINQMTRSEARITKLDFQYEDFIKTL
jgi:hypothetical protein